MSASTSCLGDELLGGHAGTQIKYLESAGGKNAGDQVLAKCREYRLWRCRARTCPEPPAAQADFL